MTKLNHIQVNVTNAVCKSFTGAGGERDRFLLVQAGKKVTVGTGNLAASSSAAFSVKVADGSSGSGNESAVVVSTGDVNNISFSPASGASANYFKLNVADDVIDSSILADTNCDIDVGDDVSGNPYSHAWTIGNDGTVTIAGDVHGVPMTLGGTVYSSGNTGPIMVVGSVGVVSTESADWLLRAKAEVTVGSQGTPGAFIASGTHTVVEQNDLSEMTMWGETTDGTWELFDESVFEGKDTIHEGAWRLHDDAVVNAVEVDRGEWLVEENSLLDVSGLLNPDLIVVDGGRVEAAEFGVTECVSGVFA